MLLHKDSYIDINESLTICTFSVISIPFVSDDRGGSDPEPSVL